MVNTCIICKKEKYPADDSRSFHKFPVNEDLRQKWLEAVGLSSVAKTSVLCSDHFDISSFHESIGFTTRKRLLSCAVPRKIPHSAHAVSIDHCYYNPKIFNNNLEVLNNITNNQRTLVLDRNFDNIMEFNEEMKFYDNDNKTITLFGVNNNQSHLNAIVLNNVKDIQETPAVCNMFNLLPDPESVIDHRVIPDINNDNQLIVIKNEESEILSEIDKNCCDEKQSEETKNFDKPDDLLGEIIDNKLLLSDDSGDETAKVTNNKKRKNLDEINPTKKIRFFIGYKTEYISPKDFSSNEAWKKFIEYNDQCKRKLRAAQAKSCRKEKIISSKKDQIKDLKDMQISAVNEYLEDLPEILQLLIARIKEGKSSTAFPEKLKVFSKVLHTYSPAGYKYIRDCFSKCLPCIETVNGWKNPKTDKLEANNTGFCLELNNLKQEVTE